MIYSNVSFCLWTKVIEPPKNSLYISEFLRDIEVNTRWEIYHVLTSLGEFYD